LHEALVCSPGSCLRRLAGTRSREMQFTRFIRNDSVRPEEMSRHAGEQTARRVAGRDVVAIQDTSELALGGRRARAAGYGPVGKGGAVGGLLLHPVLAVEVGSEALLGLASLRVWNRSGGKCANRRRRELAKKESHRWIDGMERAGEVLATAARVTVLTDREGDIYELFARRPGPVDLIVRSCQNRRLKTACETEAKLLFELIDSQPEQGRLRPVRPSWRCVMRRLCCSAPALPLGDCLKRWPSPWSRCARPRRRPMAAGRSTGACRRRMR
jgi:hypothetical protein